MNRIQCLFQSLNSIVLYSVAFINILFFFFFKEKASHIKIKWAFVQTCNLPASATSIHMWTSESGYKERLSQWKFTSKEKTQPGLVAHTCNPNMLEASGRSTGFRLSQFYRGTLISKKQRNKNPTSQAKRRPQKDEDLPQFTTCQDVLQGKPSSLLIQLHSTI